MARVVSQLIQLQSNMEQRVVRLRNKAPFVLALISLGATTVNFSLIYPVIILNRESCCLLAFEESYMPASTCPTCGFDSFELAYLISPELKANEAVRAVQCERCGTVVGVLED